MPQNPIAEVFDVFFNGAPAPKTGQIIRVTLTKKQIEKLTAGAMLNFSAGNVQLIIVSKP